MLPLAFGEAGLPVLPALRDALAQAAGRNFKNSAAIAGDEGMIIILAG